MVPDLWSHVLTSGAAPYGERQLMLAAAKQGAGDRMRQAVIAHRGAWVTERDFAMLAAAGANAVRLPVGHWVLADTRKEAAPFVEGGARYVDAAMRWGAAHGVGVMIDIHAAPGSQNGFDHSAPEKQEQRSWDAKRLLGRDNAADTVALVAALAARYATAPALLGFFLLNEPTADARKLRAYYEAAYAAVRRSSSECFIAISPRVWEHDGGNWQHLMAAPPHTRVLLDLHRYQLDFVDAEFATLTVEQHVAHARTAQRDDLRAYIARGGLPPVIGEWALAGPKYDFGGSIGRQIRAFQTAQKEAYTQRGSAGCFLWSLKNGCGNDVWSFQGALRNGWLEHA